MFAGFPLLKHISKLVVLLGVSWCVMTFVHESGHILCGYACGGTLLSADLIPWHLPYSIFSPDPSPLVTVWGGPILGVTIPFIAAVCIRRDWMWFIAYFCMLANGSYIVAAWFSGDRYLDTPRLLEDGANTTSIAAYCVLTIGFGYFGFRHQCVRLLTPTHSIETRGNTGPQAD